MKLNKKILSIIFLTFACFLGINGVKADDTAKQLDKCKNSGNVANCDGVYQFYVDDVKQNSGGDWIIYVDNGLGSIKKGYCEYENAIYNDKIKLTTVSPMIFSFNNGKYDTKFVYEGEGGTLSDAYIDEKNFVWGVTGVITGDGKNCPKYFVYSQIVYNENFNSWGDSDGKNDDGEDYSDLPGTKTHKTNDETIKLVKKIYNTIKFGIPILIIILSIIDFMKVLASGEDKAYKEAWNNFVKRVIIGIIFFLVPTIVSILLNLSGVLGIYEIDSNNIFYIFK